MIVARFASRLWNLGKRGKTASPALTWWRTSRRSIALGWTQTQVNALVVDVVSNMGDVDRAEAADTARTMIAQLAERGSGPGRCQVSNARTGGQEMPEGGSSMTDDEETALRFYLWQLGKIPAHDAGPEFEDWYRSRFEANDGEAWYQRNVLRAEAFTAGYSRGWNDYERMSTGD